MVWVRLVGQFVLVLTFVNMLGLPRYWYYVIEAYNAKFSKNTVLKNESVSFAVCWFKIIRPILIDTQNYSAKLWSMANNCLFEIFLKNSQIRIRIRIQIRIRRNIWTIQWCRNTVHLLILLRKALNIWYI